VIASTESSKIRQLYDHHKHRVFTSKNIVFPDSPKRLESTKIELLADLPFDLDNDAPCTIEQTRYIWEWIVKNLDNAIEWAENENLILSKFIRFHPYSANPNVDLSDKD
jgi:hypothetical protein